MSRRRRQEVARAAHNGVTRVLAVAMIVLGVLLVVRGAALAAVLVVALIAAGAGRLWILARLRRLR